MCNALNTFLDILERNPRKATASLQKEQLLLVCCMEMYLSELPVLLHVLCDLVHISLALVLELLVYNLYCTEVSGTPHNTSTRYFTTATQRSYLIALNIFCIRVEKINKNMESFSFETLNACVFIEHVRLGQACRNVYRSNKAVNEASKIKCLYETGTSMFFCSTPHHCQCTE